LAGRQPLLNKRVPELLRATTMLQIAERSRWLLLYLVVEQSILIGSFLLLAWCTGAQVQNEPMMPEVWRAISEGAAS
jgi:hypothetical protein